MVILYNNLFILYLIYICLFVGSLKRVSILTTDAPYITQAATISNLSDEQFEPLDVNNSTTLEVGTSGKQSQYILL